MARKEGSRLYYYTAYNLSISSALLLPELQTSAEVAADVTIRLDRLQWSPPTEAISSSEEDAFFEFSEDEAYFYWKELGTFCVRRGTEIVIDADPGVEERMLRLPLLGTVFAVLLQQRGNFVLHGSAVAIDGEAIIFLGNKGHGKSTMAAMLYGRGHELIADDVVAVRIDETGRPMVISGFPHFKLYAKAAAFCLGDDPETLPKLADGYEKRGRYVRDRFVREPLPLSRIYVLGVGEASKITPIDAQTSLRMLIANTYIARFGKHLLRGEEASLHLRKCTSLMASVPVHRLERPESLTLLPSIAQMVEESRLNSGK